MTVAFDGEIEVRRGSWSIRPLPISASSAFDTAFANLHQGLLDVSVAHRLTAVTGTLRGPVPLRVEVVDSPPPLTTGDEDVVEASFAPPSGETVLVDGSELVVARLTLEAATYRVRYLINGVDAARGRQVRRADEVAVDRCIMHLWPAAAAPDEVVRLRSRTVAAWHEAVRDAPHVPTTAELAEAQRIEQERREREREEQQRRAELVRWNGRLPGPRVASAGWALDVLARPDRDLVDLVEKLSDERCRAVAVAVVHHLADRTGLGDRWPDLAAELTAPPAVHPAPESGSVGFVVVRGSFSWSTGPVHRPPEPTPVERATTAVHSVAQASTGFDALWSSVQAARDLIDPEELARVVRTAIEDG